MNAKKLPPLKGVTPEQAITAALNTPFKKPESKKRARNPIAKKGKKKG